MYHFIVTLILRNGIRAENLFLMVYNLSKLFHIKFKLRGVYGRGI